MALAPLLQEGLFAKRLNLTRDMIMTVIINTQNKPVIPEQVKPALKVTDHPSKSIKEDATTTRSIDPAKTQKSVQETNVSKVNETEETKDQKQVSEQELDNAVSQLNTYVQSINRNLEFNIDSDSGKTVVKVIDSKTDELIRQIPNEEALHIAKQLDQGSGENSDPGIFLIKARA